MGRATEAVCRDFLREGSLGRGQCPLTLQLLFHSPLRAPFSCPCGSFVVQEHLVTTFASVRVQGTAKRTWSLDVELISQILCWAFGLCLIISSVSSQILLETDEVM